MSCSRYTQLIDWLIHWLIKKIRDNFRVYLERAHPAFLTSVVVFVKWKCTCTNISPYTFISMMCFTASLWLDKFCSGRLSISHNFGKVENIFFSRVFSRLGSQDYTVSIWGWGIFWELPQNLPPLQLILKLLGFYETYCSESWSIKFHHNLGSITVELLLCFSVFIPLFP